MIHAKNGRHANTDDDVIRSAAATTRRTVQRMEGEVEKWIKTRPLLGIGVALATGLILGCLIKRRG